MPPKPTIVKTNSRKDSVAVAKIRAVSFSELWSNYPSERIDHIDPKTGSDSFDNHCAIKVSDAMVKSGITMESFKGTKCWNCPRKNGTHIVRAQDIADWLKKRPFAGCPSTQFTIGARFESEFAGKKGIIFFKDFWQRDNEKGSERRTGDHVDLWDDGTLASIGRIQSFFRINLGWHIDGLWSDLTHAKEVIFWEFN